MKALSIKQPWAWLIINGGKDIENRSWPTKFRGRVLVHAAKGMTLKEYDEAVDIVKQINPQIIVPSLPLQRGGIIGSVEIVDCVRQSESPWFFGPCGFVLRDPKLLPFRPLKGALGFFNVSDEVMA